ncbi:hypothetical protein LINGRAHAP2_LOCUS26369 [Linum grandiflorum]
MYAIKGSWVGQTYALSKSNESSGRKARIRRSKEERKGMAELFIKKYQSLHNGNFPSLTLTQKEVGGTFYTVREIVREIIQENRVLGPGKLLPEDQHSHEWSEQYPLGTISTQPQSSSTLIPDGNAVSPDQRQSSLEEFSSTTHEWSEQYPLGTISTEPQFSSTLIPDGNVVSPNQRQSSLEEFSSTTHEYVLETQNHKAEAGQDINGSFVIVGNVESEQQKIHEFQQKDSEMAPAEDIMVAADPSPDNKFVNPVFSEVQVGGSLGNQPCPDAEGNSVEEMNSLEVRESYEQMEAKVEDQAIGIQESAIVVNAVIDSQVVAEVQDMGTAKTDNEVAGSVLHIPSSEAEAASKEQLQPENVVNQPEESVCANNIVKVAASSTPKVLQTETTDGNRNNGVISGSNGTWERMDGEKVESGPSKDGSSSSVLHHVDDSQISLLRKKSVTADHPNEVAATMDGSDSRIGVEVKSKLSNDEVSSENSPDRISDNKGSSVERNRDGQKRRDPTLERINMSWQGSSHEETNPLKQALQAIIASFVRFWTKQG